MSRQEQAVRTRATLLEAAARVFDAHGYHGAGLSLILAEAGVTRGALYFHFASKEDLARELIRVQGASIERYRSAGPGGLQGLIDLSFGMAHDLIADVRVRAGVRLVIEYATFAIPQDDAYRSWIQVVRDLLADARRRGELVRGVSIDDAARFLVSSLAGIRITAGAVAGRKELMERFADLWTYVLPGLANMPRALRSRPPRSLARAAGIPTPA